MKHFKKTVSILLVVMTILTICSTAMPVFAAGDLFSSKTFVAESYVQQEMTSKIVGEVSELREEYAKHFVCEDGSYVVATYTEPVHYKEKGKWKEIDNSLKLNSEVKSGSGKSMYAPKAGPADVSIPQSFSNDQKISATNKGHTISFGVSQGMNVRLNKSATVVSDVEELTSNVSTSDVAMLQKTMTASNALASKESEITAYNNEVMAVENQSGAIVYEDIFNNADLEYIVTTNSIKENIVVQKKQYDYTYSFDMDFGELVPIVNEDNSIRVVDPETEETVFFVAAPYMYDANCMESTDIDMTLVEDDEIYVLTLKASADWINASERVLPVVIDPTVYMLYNDVYVMSGIVNQNNTKLNNEIRIGKNLTNSTRTYIKPEIPTNIPAGSYINNAQLILQKDYYFQGLGASDIYAYAFDCYKIASWDPSTITWKNQPVDNSKNGYANCDLEFLSSVEATSGRTEYPFDITNAVRRWFAGGRNNGIMLASSNESTTTQVDFYSSRAKDSSTYPQIYITYTAPSVSIPRWETDSRAKESSAFTITASSNWTVSDNASWISLSTISGSGDGSCKIIVTENTSIVDRVGTVTIKTGNTVIGTIIVTQYGTDPHIMVSPATLNFDAGISKQTLNITSNTVWSFSDLPEWVTVTPSKGSMNSTVEVEVSVNNTVATRESNISVTADTVTKTISVAQLNDTEAPAKPDIYEEDGLVYISSRTFDFDEGTETEEHIEYKIDNGEWTDYENEPISIIRTYDATIYARVCDKAGNTSEVVSLVLESDLGEYTASYTDIALGEGLFPVEFGRTYTSTNGWFFTFDANIAKIDDNAYVFTDFYGEKQYFIKNAENKFISVDGEELTVNSNSYVLTYGYMTCFFDADGKINRITTDYLDTQYTWNEDGTLTITGGATVTFVYGRPIKINITREGQVKEVEYVWVDDNITKFIDASGAEHHYEYTNGLLTTNEMETITYSAQGRVKMISQPNGAFVMYTYNDTAASKNADTPNNVGMVAVSDSKGVTDVLYYADGIKISNVLVGYSDKAVYVPDDILNELITDIVSEICYVVKKPGYNTTEMKKEVEYTYDNNGNILTETYLKTIDDTTFITDKYVYTYAEDNKISSEKYYESNEDNSLNIVSEYLYNTYGDIISETYYTQKEQNNESVDIIIERYIREYVEGNVTSEIYQKRVNENLLNVNRTVCAYDCYDAVTEYTISQWINDSWHQSYSIEIAYNDYGNMISKKTTVYTNVINPKTGLVETTSDNNTEKIEYDVWQQPINRTINEGDLDGHIIEISLDELGRITAVIDNGETTRYTYDHRSNIITIIEGEKVTKNIYSENGNLISRENPNGTIANYAYDSYGNLIDHNFNGYSFTYNTLGEILSVNSANGELVNYTYSPTLKQRILNASFGNDQSIIYSYDDDGNITTIKFGEETRYGYEYFEEKDINDEVTKEYTELTDYVNGIRKIIEDSKLTVKDFNDVFIYSIDNVIKDEEETDSFDGIITTIGNDVNTLIIEEYKDTFKTNGTTDFTKEYTYVNDELSKTQTAGITTSYGYNAEKLISVLENTLNDISQIYGYAYDDNGNITTETLTTTSKDENGATVETNKTIYYTYDDKEQLISAETSSIKYEYTYDDRGNILTKKEYSISLDENNKNVYTLIETGTDTYSYDETWKDKLISYNGQSITYDAIGNPINYMGNVLTWTMGRQLATFGDISYTYNEDGIRTSKTSNNVTTKFYLDGTNIIEQNDGTTTLYFYYDSVGEVIGFKYNCNNYLYVKNSMGDVVGIADGDGNLIASYNYDTWGKVISVTGSNVAIGQLNPFRYRGYYYDSDIQMYYLQSRYYDPEIGRFINSDDVNYIGVTETEISYNPFAYCENDAINNIDYLGYLGWPGAIHNAVVDKIASIYGLSKNLKIRYSNGTFGYADLVDLVKLQIWEVKRNTIKMEKALKQLDKYLDGYYVNKSNRVFSGFYRGDGRIQSGSFETQNNSTYYHVWYYYAGFGIIYYNYSKDSKLVPSAEELEVYAYAVFMVSVLFSIMSVLFGMPVVSPGLGGAFA